jgi:hypothetical protein
VNEWWAGPGHPIPIRSLADRGAMLDNSPSELGRAAFEGTDPREGLMSSTPTSEPHGTPKRLWVVGVLALLWNAMGAVDYLMTETKNEAYMSQFTPEQLAYFYGFPVWFVAVWAIAVWGGVLGSLLLLFRKRFAVPVFLVSFIAMVIAMLHNYVFSNGLEIVGGAFNLIFTAAVFVVALGLYVFSRAMQRRGVLT